MFIHEQELTSEQKLEITNLINKLKCQPKDTEEMNPILQLPTPTPTPTAKNLETYNYVARCRKCKSIIFACLDIFEYRDCIAKEACWHIKNGYTFERLPSGEFLKNKFGCSCDSQESKWKRKAQWN